MLVDPWGLVMHVHKNPPLLGTLPAALKGSLDVFIPVLASHGKADPTEDCLSVSVKRVVVLEKAGIQRNSQPLTQHYKAAKCRNNVGVEVN
jgi:hypothetical protein